MIPKMQCCALAAVLLLAACGRPAGSVSESAATQPTPTPTETSVPEPAPALTMVTVEPECGPALGITFGLPEGWCYEVTQTEDEPTSTLAVRLRPETVEDGCLLVEYMQNFAVCGTGLETKDIVLNGHEASQGFYDGREVWEFIAFRDDWQDGAIMNLTYGWYEDHADTIEQVVQSVAFFPVPAPKPDQI